MPHASVVFGLNIQHGSSPQPPAVGLLSAALGIEERPLELDRRPSLMNPAPDHLCLEARGVRIVVVEPLGAHPLSPVRGMPYARNLRHSVVREMPSCLAALVALPRCSSSTRRMCSFSTSASDQWSRSSAAAACAEPARTAPDGPPTEPRSMRGVLTSAGTSRGRSLQPPHPAR